MSEYTEEPVESLAIGTRVEIRNVLTGSWSAGFTVDGRSGGGYWIRRQSDGAVLPMCILRQDVRQEEPDRLPSLRPRYGSRGRSRP